MSELTALTLKDALDGGATASSRCELARCLRHSGVHWLVAGSDRTGWSRVVYGERAPGAPRITADVVGPVCESGDYLALDRALPEPNPGELLAVMSAGAYGAVQARTYNSRALIPEVLVRKGEWALVRPRLTAEQVIALDRLPPWL